MSALLIIGAALLHSVSCEQAPMIFTNLTTAIVIEASVLVKFECYASGEPEPKISWHREDNRLLPTGDLIHHGSVLEFAAFKDAHGAYYCTAENGIGKPSEQVFRLEVYFRPVITKAERRNHNSHEIEFTCHAKAYPPPVITWTVNGEDIQQNRYHTIITVAVDDINTYSNLHVSKNYTNYNGLYRCYYGNRQGFAEESFEIYELNTPSNSSASHNNNKNNNNSDNSDNKRKNSDENNTDEKDKNNKSNSTMNSM